MNREQLKILDDYITKELEWDGKTVDIVLRKLPKLKVRVLGEYTKHLGDLKLIEQDRSSMYGERFKYYNENYDRRLSNRKDIEDMINREPEYCIIAKKFIELEVIVNHLEKLMKIVNDADWEIRSWVDVKKQIASYGEI